MPDAAQPLTDADFAALRNERRQNKLALEVAAQRAQLRALGPSSPLHNRDVLESAFNYWDPSNFVNLMDYVGHGPYGYSAFNSPWLSTRADRDYGRDRPIFQTETDLMAYRGMARLLSAYNSNAIGAIENLTSYVVGEGSTYSAQQRDRSGWDVASAKPLVDGVQRVIDNFIERNDWDGEFAELKFQGTHIDGDMFEGVWHLGEGEADARIVLPEQVTQPYDAREIEEWMGNDHRSVDWTFGVCADDDDSQNVHGYYVQWTNRNTDWDFLPGGKEPFYAPGSGNSWCQHLKVNAPAGVKRGLTDFLCTQEILNLTRKIQVNMGTSGSLSSAIAWVIQHAPGILTSQIQSMIQADATTSYTQGTQNGNSRVNYVKQYNSGTVLHTPQNQEYKGAPGAEHAEAYIALTEAMLRSAAVRWSMPEHMITGNAGNNDYASILEAGSPFVKRAGRMQKKLIKHDKKVLWKVVQWACEAGVIRNSRGEPVDFATVKRVVEICVEPARVDVRNEGAETERNERLKKNGVLSRKTWAAREGLDFEQEERNGLTDEVEEATAAAQSRAGADEGVKAPAVSAAEHTPHAARENGSGVESTLESRVPDLIFQATQILFDPQTGVYP